MNLFTELHQQLIKELLDGGVEFIIIGGYSVIFHGYERTTGDIDIWLKPYNGNKTKLIVALEQLGLKQEYLREISRIDFSKHFAFNIGKEPEKIDFITRINLVEYEEADKMKIVADMDGIMIPFLHLNHLILSKINTGRLKDQADIKSYRKFSVQKVKNDNYHFLIVHERITFAQT